MSKFGRKPIALGSVQVALDGQTISYKGKQRSGTYELPEILSVVVEKESLLVKPRDVSKRRREVNREWGLHRALLANAIYGADRGFERQLKIEGLGYKAQAQGQNIVFSLGFSHKKTYVVPSEVTFEIDKTGQVLTFRSSFKDVLGQVCSDIRGLRPPEPYKGTGIRYANEVILRKAGKAKS